MSALRSREVQYTSEFTDAPANTIPDWTHAKIVTVAPTVGDVSVPALGGVTYAVRTRLLDVYGQVSSWSTATVATMSAGADSIISIATPVVDVLPSLPSAAWPQGSLVMLSTDGIVYRNTDGSTWVSALGPQGESAGQVWFFHHPDAESPAGYEGLERIPADATEVEESAHIKNTDGKTLIDKYIMPVGEPGVTVIKAGLWYFDMWHYVSSASSTTYFTYDVYKRAIGGTETLLFSVDSPEVNDLVATEIETTYLQVGDIILLTSDRLVVYVSATTGHGSYIDAYWVYEGTAKASHIHSPINIMGVVGPPGPQGLPGEAGEPGEPGPPGIVAVDTLPVFPYVGYDEGALVYWTVDKRLYKLTDPLLAGTAGWVLAVDGGDLSTGSVTTDTLHAGAVDASKLAASIVLSSVIKTAESGSRVEISRAGIQEYSGSELTISIPSDGSEVYVKGSIEATALIVTGGASLQGATNEVASGATLWVGAGISPPSAPPNLSQSWGAPLTLNPGNAGPSSGAPVCYAPNGGADGATKVFVSLDMVVHRLIEYKVSDGTVNRQIADNTDFDYCHSVVAHGNYYYVLGSYFDEGVGDYRWRVIAYTITTLADAATYNAISMPVSPVFAPRLASDGTYLYVVDSSYSPFRLHWNKYNTAMVKQGSTIDTTLDLDAYVEGAAAGDFDFGSFRMIAVVNADMTAHVYAADGTHNTNDCFPVEGIYPKSVCYGDVDGDGARFWTDSLGGLTGEIVLTKHSRWNWGSTTPVVWVAYSWYDSDAGGAGGTHETVIGPRASTTMVKRKSLSVTSAPLPGGGTNNDPDTRRIYAKHDTVDPGVGGMKLQDATVLQTYVLDTHNASGAADAEDVFPVGAAGEIKSAISSLAGGFSLKGDGTAVITGDVGYVGQGSLWFTNVPPAGYLICNGASLARTGTYAALFAVLGTTYGAIDGSHFNLPDLRQRFPMGVAASGEGNVLAAVGGEIDHYHNMSHTHTGPSHTHDLSNHAHAGLSHAHGLGGHVHGGAAHTHTMGSHTHSTYGSVTNTGQASASGSGGTAYGNTGSPTVHRHVITSGTSGTPSTNTSDGASFSGNTGGPSGGSDASGDWWSGGPSNNTSTAAGTGTTSDSNWDETDIGNPPYLAIHFIIRYA